LEIKATGIDMPDAVDDDITDNDGAEQEPGDN